MNIRSLLHSAFTAALLLSLSGCATTLDDRAPLRSFDQGGGSTIVTYIMSPSDGQTFPAGKDIPIQAAANNMAGINQVEIYVNGQRIARDFRRPYTAVLSKPAPGKYVIHSVAYSVNTASRSSLGTVIQVK